MGNSCFVVVLLLTVLASIAKSQQDYYCYQPVDIAILLDSSSNLGKRNFAHLKTFAGNFITYFRLNQKGLGPYIGVIPYSDEVTRKKMINFRYSTGNRRLSGKMNSMKYDGGKGTRLDLAFSGARDILFKTNMGSRSWVHRVILAVTGTWRTWVPDLKRSIERAASNARADGIKVLVASFGPTEEEDRAVMESMVASKDDVFMVSFAYGLGQVAEKMVRKLCPVPSVFPCPGRVDLAFIVDSSGSISKTDYSKIKYFVYSIANALNVSSTGAHAGVVIYSTYPEMKIKFTDYTSIEGFQKGVYGLEHMKGYTRIDLGLRMAHSMLFSPTYGGARRDVKKRLAFILTDGKQNPDKKGIEVSVGEAAKPLMNDGIKTFSVGIGSQVDRDELRAMVEYDEDVITAKNFDELVEKIQNISQLTCDEITYSKCNYPADIVFVLDSSNNVKSADFQEVKRFVRTMAKLFRISPHGSRGAVIVYGDRAHLAMKMDAHKNYRDFINAVDRLSHVGGRRRTFTALEQAEQALTDFDGGARRKVPKVVLLLTAGPEDNSQDYDSLKKTTKRLHDRHALVVIVGIGPSLNNDELTSLVKSSVNLFLANSFADLKDQLVPLTNETCNKVGPGVCESKVDLAFIIDTSGSINEAEFAEAKYFVENVAKTFKISPQKTHVALMIYSNRPRVVSAFGKIKSHTELRTKLAALPHARGKTRIDLALKMAENQLFTWSGGMRLSPSVAKVAIVITDGRQSPAPDEIRLDQAAAQLLVRGVKVLSIGVGDNVDHSELNMMVNDPGKHVFFARSYRALSVQLATIARESCSRETYGM